MAGLSWRDLSPKGRQATIATLARRTPQGILFDPPSKPLVGANGA